MLNLLLLVDFYIESPFIVMSNKYQECVLNNQFDRLMNNIKPYIKRKVAYWLGYSSESITRRLLQQFSELEFHNFKSKALECLEKEAGVTIFNENIIKLNRFQYEIRNESVSITFAYFVKCVLKFMIEWNLVLFHCIKALFVTPNADKYTLVYGVSDNNFFGKRGDLEFVKFCKNSLIVPLSETVPLIVEASTNRTSFNSSDLHYSKNPLYTLLQKKGISVIEFIEFFLLHCKSMFVYLRSLFNFPMVAILKNDFSCHALASILNKKNSIKNIVITNSNIFMQPLWMGSLPGRKFITHMIWYSQNYFVYGPDICVPATYKYICADEHWVWTKSFSNILKEQNISGKFHNVGPILFYSMPEKPILKDEFVINISVFDVTPINDKWAEKMGTGVLYLNKNIRKFKRVDYCSPVVLSKFINDIVSTAKKLEIYSGKKVHIILKPKRRAHPKHDVGYTDLIKELSSNNDNIHIISPEENLYKVVLKSHIVVVLPFSSPAYVASSMGVPAIYFDPMQEKNISSQYKKTSNILLASGKNDLYEKMIDVLPQNYA